MSCYAIGVIIVLINIFFIKIYHPINIEQMWNNMLGGFIHPNFDIIRAIFWYLSYATICICIFKKIFDFMNNVFYLTACRYNYIKHIIYKIIKIVTYENLFYWTFFILFSSIISIIFNIHFSEVTKTIPLTFVCIFFFTESIAFLSVIPYLSFKRVDLTFAVFVLLLSIIPLTIGQLPINHFKVIYYIIMLIIILLSCFIIKKSIRKRLFFERIKYNEYN